MQYYFTRTLATAFLALASISLTGCYQSDTLQEMGPTNVAKNNLHQPSAGRANIYIISQYKRFCVVDCPDVKYSPLVLQTQAQHTLTQVTFSAIGAPGFACYSVKPGAYQFATASKPAYQMNVQAGQNYYYVQQVSAGNTMVYPTNAATTNAYVGSLIQQQQDWLQAMSYNFLFGKPTTPKGDMNTCSYPSDAANGMDLGKACRDIKTRIKQYQSPCQIL
jgi:hypothetical protein